MFHIKETTTAKIRRVSVLERMQSHSGWWEISLGKVEDKIAGAVDGSDYTRDCGFYNEQTEAAGGLRINNDVILIKRGPGCYARNR